MGLDKREVDVARASMTTLEAATGRSTQHLTLRKLTGVDGLVAQWAANDGGSTQ